MKKLIKTLIPIVSILFFTNIIVAQKRCKVLKKNISEHYTGRCKKGLANGKGKAVGIDTYFGHFKKGLPEGKGTYFWASGDKYIGYWKKGFRWGKGTLYIHGNSKDTIISGLWKNDKYLGPIPPKPKVIASRGVDRYTFQKIDDSRDRVLIDIYQNGSRNTEISNFIMNSSSGANTQIGNSVGFEFIDFPVEIKLIYQTFNKLHTAKIYVKFQFVISQPGDWRVTIVN